MILRKLRIALTGLVFLGSLMSGAWAFSALMVAWVSGRYALLRYRVHQWESWAGREQLTTDYKECSYWHQELQASDDAFTVTFLMDTVPGVLLNSENRSLRVTPKYPLPNITVQRRSRLMTLITDGRDDYLVGDADFDRQMNITADQQGTLRLLPSGFRIELTQAMDRLRHGKILLDSDGLMLVMNTSRRVRSPIKWGDLPALMALARRLDKQNRRVTSEALLEMARTEPHPETRVRAYLALLESAAAALSADDTRALFELFAASEIAEPLVGEGLRSVAAHRPAGWQQALEELGRSGGTRAARTLELALHGASNRARTALEPALALITRRIEQAGPGSLSLVDSSQEGALSLQPDGQSLQEDGQSLEKQV